MDSLLNIMILPKMNVSQCDVLYPKL